MLCLLGKKSNVSFCLNLKYIDENHLTPAHFQLGCQAWWFQKCLRASKKHRNWSLSCFPHLSLANERMVDMQTHYGLSLKPITSITEKRLLRHSPAIQVAGSISRNFGRLFLSIICLVPWGSWCFFGILVLQCKVTRPVVPCC